MCPQSRDVELTIIVINRNNEISVLSRCLAAIERLAPASRQVILIDDCSRTNLPDFLSRIQVQLVRTRKQRGVGFCRRLGLRLAHGKFVAFVDADIELNSFDFLTLRNRFGDHPDLVAISGRYSTSFPVCWNHALDIRRELIYFKRDKFLIHRGSSAYTTFSGGFCLIMVERCEHRHRSQVHFSAAEDIFFQLYELSCGKSFAFDPGLSGTHYHQRHFRAACLKAWHEGRGGARLIRRAFIHRLPVPPLEGVSSYPIFLCAGILFPKYLLVAMMFELFPVFLLFVINPDPRLVRFSVYQILMLVARALSAPFEILSVTRSSDTAIRALDYFLFSSLRAKVAFLANLVNSRSRVTPRMELSS